ncbi:3-hydroxyacyl-CoA dehydrogenase NAD-binding domain-containing protein [Brevundimonas sp. VNH65]|uniref:3-hydroxyacyl-CoA dehydrogenase NAD-binding domain-containing protein n=1 Tax=Brevundimonas sp. VNH65 TaxID=3400917 RepID=UPI003C09D8AE
METQEQVIASAIHGGVAVLTVDSPPVNALSAAVRGAILKGVEVAEADPAVRAVVLICAGRTFFAGADITEFGRAPVSPSLPELVDRIEAATKPVVAAIHGTALGGGLEIALACHGRIAVPSAKLGLPEVKLGLLPGAGGTQRLPRLVGVARALDMVVGGDPAPAGTALETGLIDRLAAEGSLRDDAIALALEMAGNGALRRVSELAVPGDTGADVFQTFQAANARRTAGQDAAVACVEAVRAAVELPFAEGCRLERALFLKLVTGEQSAALRHLFFAERKAADIPDVPRDTPLRPIGKVGIIGAGTMGGGIAMNFLNAGLPVTLVEMKAEALDRGVATIRKNYDASAAKGRMTPEAVEARMALLTPVLDYDALAECDLIIEAVFEEMAVKQTVFARIDAVARPGAILSTNTSYLDVNRIAAATARPQDVIGLHFFSPANVMKLLEVVRGEATAPDVIATAMALGKTIGKVAVLVGVAHGFVGNRMLAERQREAGKLILEGATPWQVDRVHQAFGLPMGPFQMADLAGLDLGWSRETSRGETIRDRLCEIDRRGQKTGAGFYDYDAARKASPSPMVEKMIADLAAEKGVVRREVSDQEIIERCLYPMVNEGARILEEKKASRASDIDVVWAYGYGWPRWRGGPMIWADTIGLPTVVEGLRRHAERFGADLTISPLLDRLAREGGRLSEI